MDAMKIMLPPLPASVALIQVGQNSGTEREPSTGGGRTNHVLADALGDEEDTVGVDVEDSSETVSRVVLCGDVW